MQSSDGPQPLLARPKTLSNLNESSEWNPLLQIVERPQRRIDALVQRLLDNCEQLLRSSLSSRLRQQYLRS